MHVVDYHHVSFNVLLSMIPPLKTARVWKAAQAVVRVLTGTALLQQPLPPQLLLQRPPLPRRPLPPQLNIAIQKQVMISTDAKRVTQSSLANV